MQEAKARSDKLAQSRLHQCDHDYPANTCPAGTNTTICPGERSIPRAGEERRLSPDLQVMSRMNESSHQTEAERRGKKEEDERQLPDQGFVPVDDGSKELEAATRPEAQSEEEDLEALMIAAACELSKKEANNGDLKATSKKLAREPIGQDDLQAPARKWASWRESR